MINIIAEIGWNHMGDMDLAKKMIINASDNGADICKFQTWSEKKLKEGAWDNDGRREIYKKAQLSKDNHIILKQVCEDKGVQFMTSIFDIGDLEFLSGLGMDIIKIPSHEVYNIELIKSVAESFNIVLVSTGAAKWEEVKKIVKTVNMNNIIFLHCVSNYPCPPEQTNLPRMKKLKELTNKEVGYSGHCAGIDDAIAAISQGATYVEKHFTVSQELPGRDNKFAIMPEQLKVLANFRDNYIKMSINQGLDLQKCELDTYNNYRGRWSSNS